MSVIRIICIAILMAIVIGMNAVCVYIARKEDWEDIPAPLISFTVVADIVITITIYLGAIGVFG